MIKINIILNKGTDINTTWQKFIDARHFDKPREIVKLSEYAMNQQIRILWHTICADRLDPMRTPTTDGNLDTPRVYTRRVGRSRYGWVEENCSWISEKSMREPYDPKYPDTSNRWP